MKLSKSFIDKHEHNIEMQKIMESVDKYLEGAKIKDADRESIYEFVYAQKMVVMDPQNFEMDVLYKKLEKLDSINHGFIEVNEERVSGVFEYNGSNNPERPASITIDDTNLQNDEALAYSKKEARIHELDHLATEGFGPNGRGTIARASMQSEILAQDSTNNIMAALGYERSQYFQEFIGKKVDDAYLISPSPSYAPVVGMAEYIKGIYGEKEVLAAQFNDEKLTTTYGDMGPMAKFGLPDYKEFLEASNHIAEITMLYPTVENYTQMQGHYLELFEKNLDNPGLNCSIETYMQMMQKINDKSMYFVVNGEEFNSSVVQSISFDIKHIYAQLHSLSSAEIEQELNPMTRSQDCQDFLIAINGLKSMDINLSTEDILNMKYYQALSNESPIIAVEVSDKTIEVDGRIDSKTGFVIIDSADISFEKVISNQHTEWGTSSYEYLPLYQEINPDFKNTIAAIKLDPTQRDDYGNNFMHAIAKYPSTNSDKIVLQYLSIDPEAATALLCAKNNEGISPIDMAADNGNNNLLRLIRDSEITLPQEHSPENPLPKQLFTSLEIASGMYDGKVRTEELIEQMMDSDIFKEGITGESPFGHAVKTENVDFFIAAVNAGYDRDELLIDELPFSKESLERIEAAIEEYENSFDSGLDF